MIIQEPPGYKPNLPVTRRGHLSYVSLCYYDNFRDCKISKSNHRINLFTLPRERCHNDAETSALDVIGSLSKPRRRRQREHHRTKGLMSKTIIILAYLRFKKSLLLNFHFRGENVWNILQCIPAVELAEFSF